VKILVTGGAGYIGGTVAGMLAEKGHQAVAFDNLSHGRRELLPSGVEFIEGELEDRLKLEEIFVAAKSQGKPFDAVLHFAALIEAGESMVHPEEFFRNNTASALALFEAMNLFQGAVLTGAMSLEALRIFVCLSPSTAAADHPARSRCQAWEKS